MGRLTKKAINAFKGRQAEETVYGEDPAKMGSAFEYSRANMWAALNWYACMKDVKELRRYLEKYAAGRTKQITPETVEALKRCKDTDLSVTMCAMARMYLATCPLPKSELDWLDGRINEVVVKSMEQKQEETKQRDTFYQSIADVESELDAFYKSDYKKAPFDLFKYLTDHEVKPGEARCLLNYYEPLLQEVQDREDLKPKTKKAYAAFVQKLLDDTNQYLANSRKETKLVRKPRTMKPKSADKVVKNVKYKQTEPSLKLVSVPPVQLHGAKWVWLYNAKTKRLTYLEGAEPMTVKGTTVVGFVPDLSISKTLRKPEKTFAELLNTTSARMIKVFKALSTKPSAANGRLNADTLILRTGK